MAERQFGPYRLVRQIAVGGMAEIHLAKTAGIAGFEKYVALKMIHPNFAEDDQFIQMLVDEAKIAVQLTHGNIAQTFDLGRVGDTYYITMEYVDGADLYKVLRRASEQDLEMPLDVCAFVAKEVSSALDHAHRKRDHAGKSLGIVHRDVSPQNVLVSYSGEVKLVDFGIAKAAMKARQTAAGVIKGKYYYMSPEQAWGDPLDHRSDIFSAGIVLYEMITGQMLYLEEDLHKLLEMARRAEIAPPSKLRRGVPPQLERIVMHALAKVPGERYQSAGDFATDLERFLHAYSPVFTASKLSTLLRQVVGDPVQVPDDPAFQSIEFRDGTQSTHPIDDAEVAHAIDRDDLRDQNSVIFRVADLQALELVDESDDADEIEAPDAGDAVDDVEDAGEIDEDAPTHVPDRREVERSSRRSSPAMLRPGTPSPHPGAPPSRPSTSSVHPGVPPSRPSTSSVHPGVPPSRPSTSSVHPGAPSRPSTAPPGRPSTAPPVRATTPPPVRPSTAPPSRPRTAPPIAGPNTPTLPIEALTPSRRALEAPAPSSPPAAAAGPAGSRARQPVPRETRATDAMPALASPAPRASIAPKLPSVVTPTAKLPSIVKPRQPNEETRRLETPAPANPLHDDSSGLLTPEGGKLGWDDPPRGDFSDDELDNIGERTLVTAPPVSGSNGASGLLGLGNFMMDMAGDDDGHVEATLVTAIPEGSDFGGDDDSTVERPEPEAQSPARDFAAPDQPTRPARPTLKAPPPPALRAKIHAPAVSELRKPRPSRRTPPGGGSTTQPLNVLHAIVSSQASEPMPAPRPAAHQPPPAALPPPPASPYPTIPQAMVPHAMIPSGHRIQADPYAAPYPGSAVAPSYNDASGMPLGIAAPGMGYPQAPGAHPHHPSQAYLPGQMQGMPPGYAPEPLSTQLSPHGYPQLSPGAMYQFQPSSQGMSLTGQMRLMEIDEIPSQYKLGAARRRWLTYIVSGLLAVSVAAAVTFLIIRSTRETAPTVGSVHIESYPPGADVLFDGTPLPNKTPLTVDGSLVGSRHTIRVELPRHKPYEVTAVEIPKDGREVSVMAKLEPLTGKLQINSEPRNAEIWINGELRGRAPTTLTGLDMSSAKRLELRLKDYQPLVQDLVWPADGKIQIDARLVR